MSRVVSKNNFPGLPPPQFRLRSLLIFVGLLCILLALAKVVGSYATLILVLFLLTVVAHVVGNAIGTRLRENNGSQHRQGDESAEMVGLSEKLTAQHFAPTTRLSRNHRLGMIVVVCVVTGAIGGSILGGWLLSLAVGNKATWANMSVGVIAMGVLGGFFGFLSSSFLKVLIAANLEAWKEEQAEP